MIADVISPGGVAIALLEVACFTGYFLKGFSGFGPALILVPTVAFLYSPTTALGTSALVDLVVGLGLAFGLRITAREMGTIFKISSVMLAGTVLGGGLAGVIPERILMGAMALVVLVFGAHILGSRGGNDDTLPARGYPVWLGALLGGFTGGLVGISGPLLVMAARPRMDKDAFRKVMVGVFLVEGVGRIVVYRLGGVWDGTAVGVALLAGPGIAVGLALGLRLHGVVTELWFGRVVGAILVGMALQIGFHALG